MFEGNDFGQAPDKAAKPECQTEAERVAATHPRCDYCGDDTPQVFTVRIEAVRPRRRAL